MKLNGPGSPAEPRLDPAFGAGPWFLVASPAATFDVGLDTRTPLALVEYRYDGPFRFTGTIDKLTFNLK